MATQPNFNDIEEVTIKFKKHINPKYSNVHTHLNDIYGFSIDDLDVLFTDDQRTTVKPTVIDIIRGQVVDIILELAEPDDRGTHERQESIKQIIGQLPFHYRIKDTTNTVRTHRDFARGLVTALRDSSNNVLTLMFHIDNLYFKPEYNPRKLQEWGLFDFPDWNEDRQNMAMNQNRNYALEHAVDSITDNLNANFDRIGNNFTRIFRNTGNFDNQETYNENNENNTTERAKATAPPESIAYFNFSKLPVDVMARYKTKQNRELIRGADLNPFKTEIPMQSNPNLKCTQLYYLDPPVTGDRLITRDGTYFHLRDQGGAQEKLFIQNTPTCHGPTPPDIRAWYAAFTVHAASKGYYIHPYFCFRKESMNSTYGFSAGADDDHTHYDLPIKYSPYLETWSQKIYQAISADRIFPKGTCDHQRDIIMNHYGGRGYEALLAIIREDLPLYQPNPTKYIRDPPSQRPRETLDQYFYRYMDYLQLRALLKNITDDLNHKGELDDFIQGTIYADQFMRLTREDRKSKDPLVLQNFSQSMILNTLNKLLKDDILLNTRNTRPTMNNPSALSQRTISI